MRMSSRSGDFYAGHHRDTSFVSCLKPDPALAVIIYRLHPACRRLLARRSGRKFGRPAKLTGDQAALARRMKSTGETAATICETLGIGRTALYRYLAEGGEN